MTAWQHDPLQEDLANHLRGNTDRMVWTNTQLGPSGSPRPDVFAVNKSYSRFACDAYEIKISVADLRRDVTSGKWQSYLKFAHRVWFAIPAGLVKLDDIPRECGVIVRHGEVWRAARKPIAKSLDTLPRDAWMKLLIEAFPDRVRQPAPRAASDWATQELLRHKLGAEVAQLFHERRTADGRYAAATIRLNEQAASIEAQIAAMREDAQKRAIQAQERLNSAQLSLARALGMTSADEGITVQALTSRLNQMRDDLHTYGIDRTIDQLNALRKLMCGEKEAA